MTNILDIALWILAAIFVWAVLAPNLWRALLFIKPASIAVFADEPAEPLPVELQPLANDLRALGFVPLGSHLERPPLGPTTRLFDFVHRDANTFATAYFARGGAPRLFFLTLLADGGCVLTSNYRRPMKPIPGRYLSAHYESWPLKRLLAAHLRMASGRPAQQATDMASRITAARRWFETFGAAEIRQVNLPGLLWTLGTLGMVAAALLSRSR